MLRACLNASWNISRVWLPRHRRVLGPHIPFISVARRHVCRFRAAERPPSVVSTSSGRAMVRLGNDRRERVRIAGHQLIASYSSWRYGVLALPTVLGNFGNLFAVAFGGGKPASMECMPLPRYIGSGYFPVSAPALNWCSSVKTARRRARAIKFYYCYRLTACHQIFCAHCLSRQIRVTFIYRVPYNRSYPPVRYHSRQWCS